MARLKVHVDRLIENIETITAFMRKHEKEWSLVVKVLGTDKAVLAKILQHPAVLGTHSIAVSQWKSLRLIKELNPTLRTMYIKPPSIKNVAEIVKYADISLNSTIATIKALSGEAVKQDKMHQIIVMVEMGELREGIKREGLIEFYNKIFKLPKLQVIGIGTNLGCMYGIQPTYDKLIQLVLFEQIIEAKFKRSIELVSGATSITMPIMERGKVPKGINHFRIGEAAFLGTSPLQNKPILGLNTGAFTFEASIVELYKKANQPDGIISDAAIGNTAEDTLDDNENTSYRAIMDFGVLDVDAEHLIPEDPEMYFFGNSSDLTVYDLGDNPRGYKTGDTIKFRLKYMAVAKLMYSRFVEKEIIN
ncbi:MAG: alanine racemase [Candidatus Cloacimonetes bacterium]|nr:alanine racemase [Candidatus Cloacimonadota bacterium]MCB5286956.1 alanine racemase [Candidatus Cloacimonadota bacterium]MCK9185134.1 alanine racemase [Candidatus Cloacimonadota bacterium]MCK9583621.1 alanine racemase [Candidatus Cloacimonadota bacterium]MDY0229276.1 alanine racemase [Candidatus Cloacimonadaceae bacterium]